ncbi:MAG: BatA domain-containing protein [Gemmatimonadaceae bacterium]|nr:BatA domain-containing protein [Gemmatimonadaceae bacterium]
MSFLAPGFFLASLVVVAAVVALHFIVTRQPRAGVLPTARFVPDLPAMATARATRPSDIPLMLLRVLLILAAGAGLARPVIKPSRGADARVILVDISRAVRDASAMRDSAQSVYRDRDVVIVFDSSARSMSGSIADSLASLTSSRRRGNLSGALIAALRAGSSMRERADSLELVIVSPLAADEMDAATDSIRTLWPGGARIVQVGAPRDSGSVLPPPEIRAVAGDPMQVTVSLVRSVPGTSALIVRGPATAQNSQAIVSAGRAYVEWAATTRPRGTAQRAARDTVGGVLADTALIVAGFERRWTFATDSIRGGHVVARWIDGEPAAMEWPAGDGCIRSVAIPVASAGDFAIGHDFVRFVAALSGPCIGRVAAPTIPASVIMSLAGSGGLAPREAFRAYDDVRSPLAPWLLGLALAAALGELIVRRRDNVTTVTARSAAAPITSAS